jgi:serine/threonine protein kinase
VDSPRIGQWDFELTPERYHEIKRVFAEACRLEAGQRAAYLDQACAGDAELRAEVEGLLHHDEKSLPIRPRVSAAAALGLDRMDAGAAAGSSALAGFQPAPEQVPERIGEFRIIGKIGQGGMGVVYEAEQDHPRRRIALKVIRPGVASGQVLRRFQLEAQVLGRLQHPGIAQVYEAGTAQVETSGGLTVEQPFFAMEFVRGKPLNEHLEATPLGTRQRLELFAKVCDAVQHAHQKGVIHRDLKPGNILVDESGQPKILDFGVARLTDADVQVTTLQTDVGQLIGTIPYMSPEQVAGDSRELDTRSDVYALGVVCYQLLTGRLPYDLQGKTIPEAARSIAEEDPVRLSSVNRVFRGDLDTIVAKALEKDKNRRYQSASDLAADVRRYLSDQPISARPATTVYQLRKFARRNKALVGGVLVAFVALLIGIIGTTSQAIRATHERDRAQGAETLAEQRFEQAEDARKLAEQRHSEALAETARATAFGDFLARMLEQIKPEVALGRDVALLRAVLDEAADDIQTELAEHPDVQASIHHVIGTVYRSISVYDQAEQHLQAAYDLRVQHLGESDPETLASLAGLAEVRWNQGRLDEAEAMYERLIASYADTLGDAHRETLIARYSLAGVLKDSGRLDEAEQELRDVVALMQTHLSEQDDALLDAMNGLALLAVERGQLDEAEQLLRTLVQRWTDSRGPRHPKRLRALRNLATIVKERGDLAEAEELTREALELGREVFGEDHHDTIQAKINLASLLRERGQLDEAEPLAREALEQAMRVLGPEHPDTLKAISHLGITLRLAGKFDEAQTLLEDAVALSEKLYGPHDPRTLNSLSSLAGLLYEQRKLEEAETIMRRVVDGLREAHGESSSQTVAAMNNLGLLLVELGKLEEAEKTLQTVIRLTDQAAPPGHWFRWTARVSYGECLVKMKRFEEAEQLLLECYAGLTSTLGPEHYRTRDAAEKLVTLYEAWGRPEEAAKYADTPSAEPADPDAEGP